MNYYMVRSFDHAGYYETRLLLMVVGLLVAGWRAARGDRRYLVVFLSGVFFQALLEFVILLLGFRGAGYRLSVFGVTLPPALAVLYQGSVEGGILALMSFWFADVALDRGPARGHRALYAAVCVLIVVLASGVGWYAAGRPITSPRPMFASSGILINDSFIVSSLFLLWLAGGRDGFRATGWWFLGSVVYSLLNFEPMHLLGARYIAIKRPDGVFTAAPYPAQATVMAWAHLVEFAAGKLHYFVIPSCLGLVRFPSLESRS